MLHSPNLHHHHSIDSSSPFNSSTTSTNNSHQDRFANQPQCVSSEQEWLAFFLSSVVTFVGGILVLLLSSLMSMGCRRHGRRLIPTKLGSMVNKDTRYFNSKKSVYSGDQQRTSSFDSNKVDWYSYIRELARELVSAQRKSGRLLATCVLVCSIGSLVLYIIDTYRNPVESCISFSWHKYKLQQVDFLFNLFFLVFFFIRFAAAHNKLAFWFELSSLVDFFTVPPSFVAIYLKRNWLGFRFLRAVRLINIPELLIHTGVLRSRGTISISRLCCNFTAFLICAAGFVHLVENSGDFFLSFSNARHLSFFDCVYFMIVTLTTVGYGDITCVTYTGKAFMLSFLLSGLTFFAMLIPQLSSLFGVDRRFAGTYHSIRGRKHVVVCGEINFRSLSAVIEDFLHSDREESRDIDVCILHRTIPSIELEALMKRHSPYVNYFVGSSMLKADLERVLMKSADACILLVDRECTQTQDADFANIMRVIAVKNHSPHTKILLQLLHYNNKSLVMHIPHWTEFDEIICISEIKLGLLSQSCLAFGFSTMMANIFRVTSDDSFRGQPSWRDLYCAGASMEIYTCSFSQYFEQKSFKDAALICFKLGVLLIAVEFVVDDFTNEKEILINPGSSFVLKVKSTRGFVLASSSEEAKRIKNFCGQCHVQGETIRIPGRSPCSHAVGSFSKSDRGMSSHFRLQRVQQKPEFSGIRNVDDLAPKRNRLCSLNRRNSVGYGTFADFHSTNERSIEEATLNHEKFRRNVGNRQSPLRNHVILFLFANEESPLIGLRCFVLPLRASNIAYDELHPIILVGSIDYFRKEWPSISTFPLVFIYDGFPNSMTVMTALNMSECHASVVISLIDRDSEDTYLIDKSAILCTLCIRSFSLNYSGQSADEADGYGSKVPRTITDLEIETNVQYVQEDEDEECEESSVFELYKSSSFASGSAFVDTIIDYIISTAYYNDKALRLIRCLINGGEGSRTFGMFDPNASFHGFQRPMLHSQPRSRLNLVKLNYLKSFLNLTSKCVSFGDLFQNAMLKADMLCLGIYRSKALLRTTKSNAAAEYPAVSYQNNIFNDYVVICFPSALLTLYETDQIYVFEQFSAEKPKT